MKTQKGFTIVELLIVIVVMAILAAITIVAFNGVRQRAEDTKLVSVINSYIKAVKLYKAENGTYPNVSTFCLGVEGDLPATARFANNICGQGNCGNCLRNDTLNAALAPYMKTPPRANFTEEFLRNNGQYLRGIIYSGDAGSYYYSYPIKPNRSCPIGNVEFTETNVRSCYDYVDS
ncbi:MAG: type II secretion system protein [Patescibacteria group bacterium]